MIRFILKTIKGNKKKYVLMSLVLSIVVSFFYVFLSLYESISGISADIVMGMGIDVINFLALALGVFVIIRINNYIIDDHTQEYALLLLTGRNFKQLLSYVFMHTGSILLLCFVVGGLLGNIWVVLINAFYKFIHIDFIVHLPSLFSYILIYPVCMIILLAISIMKINMLDLNINDHLRSKFKMKTLVPQKKTVPYLIFTVIGILFLSSGFKLTFDSNITMSSYTSFIGVIIGIVFVSNFLIPFLYYAFHNSLVLRSKKIMFILNGFMELSTTLALSFGINSIIIPILLASLIIVNNEILKYSIITLYILVLFMIMICFVLQLNMYCRTLIYKINTLKSLGLKSKEMKFIQIVQVFLYLLVISLPFIAFYSLLYNSYLSGLLDMQLLLLLAGGYVIVYLFIGIYMIIKFNMVIKEAYGYVKYLNRS